MGRRIFSRRNMMPSRRRHFFNGNSSGGDHHMQIDDKKKKKKKTVMATGADPRSSSSTSRLLCKEEESTQQSNYFPSSPRFQLYHEMLQDYVSDLYFSDYEDDQDFPPTILIPDLKQKGICTSHPLKHRYSSASAAFNNINFRGESSSGGRQSREKGECSWSECVVCGEDKPTGVLVRSFGCEHYTCMEECVRVCVQEKIQEYTNPNAGGPGDEDYVDVSKKIKCPKEKCNAYLGVQQLWDMGLIPEQVLERILDARREKQVLAHPRWLRCPLDSCNAVFVDHDLDKRACFDIKACPGCWRLFCTHCRHKCHLGLTCHEYYLERQAVQARARTRAMIIDLEDLHHTMPHLISPEILDVSSPIIKHLFRKSS